MFESIRQRIPVRRNSYPHGHEGGFWRPIGRRAAWRIVLAARRFNLARKQPGSRNGPLGHIGIEVLELLANTVDYRSGRLDPSIDWLQRKLRRSRAAIVAALDALRRLGFLDWRRRYEVTGEEGRGCPPRQISNAYRLVMPAAAAAMLGTAPLLLPDDVEIAKAERAAEVHAQERDELDASPLGASLARLRESIRLRKFTERPETGSGLESNSED